MNDITELMALVEQRNGLRHGLKQAIAAHSTKLVEVNAKIEGLCFHPTTVKKTYHSPGGHEHRSRSSRWDACTICGKYFNSVTTEGDYE
jgi:hypothetical protein